MPGPVPSPSRSTRPPAKRIMRSVWSREAAGSLMLVSPEARSPARRMQDFTWADATEMVCVMPRRAPPRMLTGGRVLPLRPATVAPMAARGRNTRAIGRRRMLPSPVSTQRKSHEATNPGSRRMRVPELATSMTSSGSRRPCQPAPCTTMRSLNRSTRTPRASTARTVASVSAELRKPVTSTGPSLTAPKSTARCETDLSPGAESRPRRPQAAGRNRPGPAAPPD